MGRHRMTWDKTAARAPGGLYGYTKRTQKDCEVAVRRLNKQATRLAKSAYKKDKRIAKFLATHAKRAKSRSAKILLEALRREGEQLANLGGKLAASRTHSLYGYPSNTVKSGLAICASLRERAGDIAASLHARRVARHGRITGFFKEHSKTARCACSKMLLASYPDPDAKYAKTAAGAKEIHKWQDMEKLVQAREDSWLGWDMDLGDNPEHYG